MSSEKSKGVLIIFVGVTLLGMVLATKILAFFSGLIMGMALMVAYADKWYFLFENKKALEDLKE